MFLFVAARIRTSTLMSSRPPTRKNSLSCSTWRIFDCRLSGISPISSSRNVPPWASSNRPGLRAPPPGHPPLARAPQLFQAHRLVQEISSPCPGCFHDHLGVRRVCEGDDRDPAPVGPKLAQELPTGHVGKVEVDEHQGRRRRLEALDGFPGRRGADGPEPRALQAASERSVRRRVWIDYEGDGSTMNARHGVAYLTLGARIRRITRLELERTIRILIVDDE